MKPLGRNPLSFALSLVFRSAVACRNRWYDMHGGQKTGRPTFSVGGIHAGGTGKTPMAVLLGKHLERLGYEVAFLSRGYKRSRRGPVAVQPGERVDWQEIGDEPYMLHEELPQSWLGIDAKRSRIAARMANLLKPKAAFVLDDGFQHRSLHRDRDIVCLPPDPFSDRLLPAGYLREPLSSLGRAHALCLVGGEEDDAALEKSRRELEKLFPRILVVTLRQKADGWVKLQTGERADKPPVARPALVSAIARPERFVSMVERAGIRPHRTALFDDHHVFAEQEIQSLFDEGADSLITTQKDACRLNSLKLVYGSDIWYLRIRLGFCVEQTAYAFGVLLSEL